MFNYLNVVFQASGSYICPEVDFINIFHMKVGSHIPYALKVRGRGNCAPAHVWITHLPI